MSVRNQITAAVVTVAALVALSSSASAQCSGPGSGSTALQVATLSDQEQMMPAVYTTNFDLFSLIRSGSFAMFSWGRGPVGHPFTVRSSFAVLRERRGLMR